MIYRVASANTPEGFEEKLNGYAEDGFLISHIYDPGSSGRYTAIMELEDDGSPNYEKWR